MRRRTFPPWNFQVLAAFRFLTRRKDVKGVMPPSRSDFYERKMHKGRVRVRAFSRSGWSWWNVVRIWVAEAERLKNCSGSNGNCYVSGDTERFHTIKESNYSPKVATTSRVYDKALNQLADALNAALNTALKNEFQRPDHSSSQREIGLASLDDGGIGVVWKVTTIG